MPLIRNVNLIIVSIEMGISNCKKPSESISRLSSTVIDGDVTPSMLYPTTNQPKSFYNLYLTETKKNRNTFILKPDVINSCY
jgi:hypothetical protein